MNKDHEPGDVPIAAELLKQFILQNSNFDLRTWFSVLLGATARVIRATGRTYDECIELIDACKKDFKHLWPNEKA